MKGDQQFIERANLVRGKMSVSAFAKYCGVGVGTMSNYLKGETDPTISVLRKIAQAAGVTVGWLVGDEITGKEQTYSAIAHGNGNIQAAGSVDGASINVGSNYSLTKEEVEQLELERKYATPAMREGYIKQLRQIKEIVNGRLGS